MSWGGQDRGGIRVPPLVRGKDSVGSSREDTWIVSMQHILAQQKGKSTCMNSLTLQGRG